MERKNIESIGDVLRMAIEESRMTGRLDECRACDTFAAIVGPDLASQCARPQIRKGVMTVKVQRAPLRQELAMHRSSLMRAINTTLGKTVVTELRII